MKTRSPDLPPAAHLCEAEQAQAEFLTDDETEGAVVVLIGLMLAVLLLGFGLGYAVGYAAGAAV